MRRLFKFLLICVGAIAGLIVLVPVLFAAWLYFYSGGLPDLNVVAQFAPSTSAKVSDPCLYTNAPISVIPYDAMGSNVKMALTSAERIDDRGILEMYFQSLWYMASKDSRIESSIKTHLSGDISRHLMCVPSRGLKWQFDTTRLAVQLDKRFSHQELFTIYANRHYFGEGQFGVEAASHYYFHKEPSQLLVPEAALLAGLLKSPTRYSPRFHPDLALERRNQVIDAMVAAHAISGAEGEAAKKVPLPVLENSGSR